MWGRRHQEARGRPDWPQTGPRLAPDWFRLTRTSRRHCFARRSRLSPLQAEDGEQDAAAGVGGPQDKDAAQDIEVQLVFWDGAEQPGLEEGGPLPLQSPLAAPVALHTHTHTQTQETRAWVFSYTAAASEHQFSSCWSRGTSVGSHPASEEPLETRSSFHQRSGRSLTDLLVTVCGRRGNTNTKYLSLVMENKGVQ